MLPVVSRERAAQVLGVVTIGHRRPGDGEANRARREKSRTVPPESAPHRCAHLDSSVCPE